MSEEVYMNFPSCEATSASMKRAREEISNLLLSAVARVNEVVDVSWRAPSATQFQSEFGEWRSQMEQLLTQLDNRIAVLDQEIIDLRAKSSDNTTYGGL